MLLGLLLVLGMGLLPATALADNGDSTVQNDFMMRIRADVHVASGEHIGSLMVIKGNATIDGIVDKSVVVIDGDAVVSGSVGGNLTVISGKATLLHSATVKSVTSIRGSVERSAGATVTGRVQERDGFTIPVGVIGLFSMVFWAGMTIAVVVAGLIFAMVGGRQLNAASSAMTESAVNVMIGFVTVWVAIPVLAVVALITIVGIPLGVGALVFLLPALWFLGFIVAGARLGRGIIGLARTKAASLHPYAATTLGLVILQLVVLVPVLGGIAVMIAGLWGAGALAYTAYRAAGGKDLDTTSRAATPPPLQTQQPAG